MRTRFRVRPRGMLPLDYSERGSAGSTGSKGSKGVVRRIIK